MKQCFPLVSSRRTSTICKGCSAAQRPLLSPLVLFPMMNDNPLVAEQKTKRVKKGERFKLLRGFHSFWPCCVSSQPAFTHYKLQPSSLCKKISRISFCRKKVHWRAKNRDIFSIPPFGGSVYEFFCPLAPRKVQLFASETVCCNYREKHESVVTKKGPNLLPFDGKTWRLKLPTECCLLTQKSDENDVSRGPDQRLPPVVVQGLRPGPLLPFRRRRERPPPPSPLVGGVSDVDAVACDVNVVSKACRHRRQDGTEPLLRRDGRHDSSRL